MTEAEEKQLVGLKAKLKDYKRFLSVYRGMKAHCEDVLGFNAQLVRENTKLVKVLTAIGESEDGIDSVPELSKYARRVVESMGY